MKDRPAAHTRYDARRTTANGKSLCENELRQVPDRGQGLGHWIREIRSLRDEVKSSSVLPRFSPR